MIVRLVPVVILCTTGLVQGQTSAPPGDVKIYEIGKDGLRIDGKLTKDDPPLVNVPVAELNGAPHQVFHVKLQKGQSYVIDLVSKDFDAYLILQNAIGKVLAQDDDGGGDLNSRIVYVAKADGSYRLLAAGLDRKVGAFQLKLRLGELTTGERLAAQEYRLAVDAVKLNEEALQHYRQGKVVEALAGLRQSLELYQRLFPEWKYPDGHPNLATSLDNLSLVMQAAGAAEKALLLSERALAMRRKLYPVSKYPDGHARLVNNLNNMGIVLQAVGSTEKAMPVLEEALAMCRKLYPQSQHPDGHADLARSLSNMGAILQAAGSAHKALPFCEQALAINRKLHPGSKYPEGHSDLAASLFNMGSALHAARSSEQALPLFEQALAMRRKLYPESKYPDGHPELATSLSDLGHVWKAVGAGQKALDFYQQAVAMRSNLYRESKYPDGHPDLAASLSNVGLILHMAGLEHRALPFYERALAMERKLFPESKYPDGHPAIAVSLTNIGALLLQTGSSENALSLLDRALAIMRAHGQRLLLTMSEEGALAHVQSQPPTRDFYLSAALQLPAGEAPAYGAVWQSKAAVSRILELRHAAAHAAGPAASESLIGLKENRRRTEQLLQDIRRRPADRDKELARLADERDATERLLAKDLPILARWSEREKRTPDDLANVLPVGAVFVDLLTWIRFEHEPKVMGKGGARRTPSYLGFMVTPKGRISSPSSMVQRIDLGPAAPINAAILAWRQAIERRDGTDDRERLRTLLWDKIAKHLPPGTKTIYIAPDGDLARLPWSALPIGRDRVLLEDFALATVPDGPFLLEHLQEFRESESGRAKESVLTLGDVLYNSTWPALPGTRAEIGAISALAPHRPVALTKTDATPTKLTDLLPSARYAHLATHGEFQADAFAAEEERLRAARHQWEEGQSQDARRVAAKNPLGYVGLVLADGNVLTGLSILDLDLSNLKLVTLSACETGLGELTGGKGVENLQQAFHIAGCPNVVASLWKVNDAATAALMTKFYHELWVNKKPPIEALRESQLTIYRHPELIPDLAGERGPVRLKKAVAVKSEPSAKRQATADTKLWAAFVLSGVGK